MAEGEETLLRGVLVRHQQLEDLAREEQSRAQQTRSLYARLKDLYTSQQNKMKVLQSELSQVHSESSEILSTSRTALNKADQTIREQQAQIHRLEEQLNSLQQAKEAPPESHTEDWLQTRVLELEVECARLSSLLEHTSASHSRDLDLLRAQYLAKMELLARQQETQPATDPTPDPQVQATLEELQEEVQKSQLQLSLLTQQNDLLRRQHVGNVAELTSRLQDLENQLYHSRKHSSSLEELLSRNKVTFSEMRCALKKHQEESQDLRKKLREVQRSSRQSSLSAQMANDKLQRACTTQTEKLRLQISELGQQKEVTRDYNVELEKLELEHSHKLMQLEEERHKSHSKMVELQESRDQLLKEVQSLKDSPGLSDRLETKLCNLRQELDQALEQTTSSEKLAQDNLRLREELQILGERHLQYGETVRSLHQSLKHLKKETARELSRTTEQHSAEQRQLRSQLEQVTLELVAERQRSYQERLVYSRLIAGLKSKMDSLSSHLESAASGREVLSLVQEVQHHLSGLTEALQLS